jgi:hypothetical protein
MAAVAGEHGVPLPLIQLFSRHRSRPCPVDAGWPDEWLLRQFLHAIGYGPAGDEALMGSVAVVHEDEGAPVVAVPDAPADGLVGGPEGVHDVPAFA